MLQARHLNGKRTCSPGGRETSSTPLNSLTVIRSRHNPYRVHLPGFASNTVDFNECGFPRERVHHCARRIYCIATSLHSPMPTPSIFSNDTPMLSSCRPVLSTRFLHHDAWILHHAARISPQPIALVPHCVKNLRSLRTSP